MDFYTRYVDGTFSDDVGGLPEEHGAVMGRINMTGAQLQALQYATAVTHQKLVTALIAAGKYNWQAFGGGDGAGASVPGGAGEVSVALLNTRSSIVPLPLSP